MNGSLDSPAFRGYATLSGPALRLYQRLQGIFDRWSARWPAEPHLGPPLIAARTLDRVGYFQSFPHLATFPAALADDRIQLRHFAGAPFTASGDLALTALAPGQEVLTPAACYHLYPALEGARLEGPRFLGISAPCFRREAAFVPLERQWSFTMQEVVCLGTAEEVGAFLARARARIDELVSVLGLPARWEQATDPFFDPRDNPKLLLQKVAPLKRELVYRDQLAIASLNFHQAHFGAAFDIGRGGSPAFSACAAFGVERWVAALLESAGPDERSWPL
jgi:seryl-tRNA synthetase